MYKQLTGFYCVPSNLNSLHAKNKQTNTQTNKQTNKQQQTNKQTNKQTLFNAIEHTSLSLFNAGCPAGPGEYTVCGLRHLYQLGNLIKLSTCCSQVSETQKQRKFYCNKC
jgi:hypothetical protein